MSKRPTFTKFYAFFHWPLHSPLSKWVLGPMTHRARKSGIVEPLFKEKLVNLFQSGVLLFCLPHFSWLVVS